ncbi:sensor histidine kinase [Faecalibaculum rodentium]|uniref:sensor histidine kinase n=1 Tax=Faecalibaculum rodentium TaxID=1702221 RepID=UPI00258A0544|nr:ATP-binding protein [Faecalibaculum rodentium]
MKVRREEQENFAHQLKSSLNSLSLRLELEGLYEPAEESFALMDSQRDKFIQSSRIHYNNRLLDMKLFSLKEVLEQDILPSLDGYKVRIVTKLDPGWLYGDSRILREGVETLLVNACRNCQQVQIALVEQETGLELTVSNETKSGILPSMNRYETSDDSHYGIGLDLAKTVARLHGGDLSLTLEDGRFNARLFLPVHPWESDTAMFMKESFDSMNSEVKPWKNMP